MLTVESIGKIQWAGRVHEKSIRSISKSMGVSRNTVRRILRSDVTDARYVRLIQPHPMLGDFIPALERLLEDNARKRRRDRLNAKRLWQLLADQGCEAYQFDWSLEYAVLGGATVRLRAAHMRLCYSRMGFLRAYPRESQEMVFDAHDRAFERFGGACVRGIYDSKADQQSIRGIDCPPNKTAVDAADGIDHLSVVVDGGERVFGHCVEIEFGSHGLEPVLLGPAREHGAGDVRRRHAGMGGDHRRLMAARGQPPDLAHGKSVGECDGSLGEKSRGLAHAVRPMQGHGVLAELVGQPVGLLAALAPGDAGDAATSEMTEQRRAPALPVEHQGQRRRRGVGFGGQHAHFAQFRQNRLAQDPHHAGIDLLVQAQEGRAVERVAEVAPGRDTLRALRTKYPGARFGPLRLRLVQYTTGGTRFALATTLLDADTTRIEDLAALYHGRWGIEELFKISKGALSVEDFHGQSKRAVKQELFAHFILITLTRLFANQSEDWMNRGRQGGPKPAMAANFKNSLATVARNIEALLLQHATALSETVTRIVEGITACRQRLRPNRSYPRRSRKPVGRWSRRKVPKARATA